MISPCYLVIVVEGHLICRDPNNYTEIVDDVAVQTNIDHDVKSIDTVWANNDPLLLNSIERRNCHFNSLNSNEIYTIGSYFNLLQIDPGFNEQTIYSCVQPQGNTRPNIINNDIILTWFSFLYNENHLKLSTCN